MDKPLPDADTWNVICMACTQPERYDDHTHLEDLAEPPWVPYHDAVRYDSPLSRWERMVQRFLDWALS